eukprot:CAMPEP_0195054376 /NCGR_PEP_ID=MMETSP0448-20130528/3325_1 /TAXON_ID=66468 /ORGANISM="Heterocapsa triquestra, Strain CCMP 448" /LENGTH=65 /DNA_ID=CAMNT_0040083863 /DNA_START=157 /DNA_END=354 /DNA_ORIENTATION=+
MQRAAEHEGWVQWAFEGMGPHQARAVEVIVAATSAAVSGHAQLEEDQVKRQGFFSGFEGLFWDDG